MILDRRRFLSAAAAGVVLPFCNDVAWVDAAGADAGTIIDRATYREPTLPPVGVPDVIVGGTPVVRDGRLLPGALPGRAIRAPTGG